MNTTQLFYDSYLVHHGVKGMKWGRRKWQNADGSLTPAGIKRYAKKGYAQDSYKSNKTAAGKVYDRVTGAHKIAGDMKYDASSKKQNRARAEKYLADKTAKNHLTPKQKKERMKKAAAKGAAKTAKILGNIGTAYISDQVFNDGRGTAVVKTTVKYAGRAAVSAYIKARGGWDIRWYDN